MEKSIWVQRLGVESNTFLHDRQTWVIVIRGAFMGKWLSSHSFFPRVKKRGIRAKTFFGNRFIGCRIDSSERSFGRTFVSSELLTLAIYKHSCESGVLIEMSGGRLVSPYLCSCGTVVLIVSIRSVSSLPAHLGLRSWTTRTCCCRCVDPTAFPTVGGVESLSGGHPGRPLLSRIV